jgi:hypothetical protein
VFFFREKAAESGAIAIGNRIWRLVTSPNLCLKFERGLLQLVVATALARAHGNKKNKKGDLIAKVDWKEPDTRNVSKKCYGVGDPHMDLCGGRCAKDCDLTKRSQIGNK